MARPKNTEARRRQIARAFVEVLAARGYEGASNVRVAERAGLAPGLVHYHFRDKEEVLVEAVHELRRSHERWLEMQLEEVGGDALDRLRRFLELHLATGPTADPVRVAAWVAMSVEAARRPAVAVAVRAALTAWVDRLTILLVEARAAGLVRSPRPRADAAALVAAVQGAFLLASAAPDVMPAGSAGPSLLAMAEGLIDPTRALRPPASGADAERP
jgi:TetR/AcrR family transcriptional repressor of bet genes